MAFNQRLIVVQTPINAREKRKRKKRSFAHFVFNFCSFRFCDYIKPQTPITIKDKAEENYILCKYENNIPKKGETLTLTTYVLPTKTRLGLAVFGKLQTGVGEIDIVNAYRKGWFTADNLSFGDGATGVISPDVNGNYFYFRRNHKYVITGNTNNAHY